MRECRHDPMVLKILLRFMHVKELLLEILYHVKLAWMKLFFMAE